MRLSAYGFLCLLLWGTVHASPAKPRNACDLRAFFTELTELRAPPTDPIPSSAATPSARRPHGTRLSVENGDAPLRAIRMGWHPSYPISFVQFDDMTQAMKKMKSLELWIGAYEPDAKLFGKIAKLSPRLQKRIHVVESEYGPHPSVWTQDASKPLENGDTLLTSLDKPPYKEYASDPAHTEPLGAFAEADKIHIQEAIVPFQGGNVVVGARHVFVGSDDVAETMSKLHLSRPKALAAMADEFGRPVLEIGIPRKGKMQQIDFHIDLTLAVVRNRKTGREVILLDSPLKAFEALLTPFGVKNISSKNAPSLKALIEASTRGRLKSTDSDFEEFLTEFNFAQMKMREAELQTIATQLQNEGYEVVRVPGLNEYKVGSRRKEKYRTEIYNYTNSIFSQEYALIPHMGVRVLDEAFAKIVRGLGYEPIPMSVTQESFCSKGGIRCLSETYRKYGK